MKFSVQHGIGDHNWHPEILAADNVISWSRAVEESGWDAIAFTDHPAPSSKWVNAGGEGSSDPFSSLAFCAAVTARVKLMTAVVVLPYRNPLFTAHQIGTVDRLSGGRLILGVGTGYLRGEFRAAGADFENRRAEFDEAIEILRTGWTAPELSYEGRRFTAAGTVLQPAPAQTPHPPLWIHGNSRWGTHRAAHHGDGWMITLTDQTMARTIRTAEIPDLAAVKRRMGELHEEMAKIGRDPGEVAISVSGLTPMLDVRAGWNTDQLLTQLGELEAAGVDWLGTIVVGDDPAASEETVRRFGEEIIQAS